MSAYAQPTHLIFGTVTNIDIRPTKNQVSRLCVGGYFESVTNISKHTV